VGKHVMTQNSMKYVGPSLSEMENEVRRSVFFSVLAISTCDQYFFQVLKI